MPLQLEIMCIGQIVKGQLLQGGPHQYVNLNMYMEHAPGYPDEYSPGLILTHKTILASARRIPENLSGVHIDSDEIALLFNRCLQYGLIQMEVQGDGKIRAKGRRIRPNNP